MLVFHVGILLELGTIELDDIEDVLGLLEHLILLQVLQPSLQLETGFIVSNELCELFHAFFSPSHGNE